ncbi:hypothetical protein BDV38DRAFT_243176 [Aspergillus pseudotamarii]|uniref:Uncharacterized protein n=1 Tax=Aspergillus pseudotamarii TaxID=132259 RepID=A0A5N6SXA1_ASPPS|nr:uncharacterized protein BDV38DRAFT_243176 [Aspergillus pseudotamarii]KAE8139285.1 hypothetical protein BDV38DRAFT_243176 [Aspergillus pseudotamarii]
MSVRFWTERSVTWKQNKALDKRATLDITAIEEQLKLICGTKTVSIRNETSLLSA